MRLLAVSVLALSVGFFRAALADVHLQDVQEARTRGGEKWHELEIYTDRTG